MTVQGARNDARLGLGFLGDPDARQMAGIARAAEAAGFESVWSAETRFTRDAITTATAIALETSRVRIGTSVINVYTRGAALVAVTMATLDELSGGRAILGIGPGSPLILAAQGLPFHRPLARLREFVAAVRAVWRGEDFAGDFVAVQGVRLDFDPPRQSVPIYLGVTGPKALALAGEIADGVILNSPTPVEYTRRAARIVREAAVAAGRDPNAVEIAGDLMLALDTAERPAREIVAPMVATYLTRFPNLARESGLAPEVLDEFRSIAGEHGIAALAAQIPAEIVDALAVAGSPEHVRQRIAAYRAAGMDLPVLSPGAGQMERVVRDLAPGQGQPAAE
jgi:5,10-methylenetetrahydromethanopterin reductase